MSNETTKPSGQLGIPQLLGPDTDVSHGGLPFASSACTYGILGLDSVLADSMEPAYTQTAVTA